MDLRTLPDGLSAPQRVDERRTRVENKLGLDLSLLQPVAATIGSADEKNCEQMIGTVPLPVGLAGPLAVIFSDETTSDLYLPLATTEGALVASVNRGCKALTAAGGAETSSTLVGITRSIAIRGHVKSVIDALKNREEEWKAIGEATSSHLKILSHTLDQEQGHVFLTIACDTDDAMGMNMITIAAQAIGKWIEREVDGAEFITVAANVDSDKKPSLRTAEHGRGFVVTADVTLPDAVLQEILKSDAAAMHDVAVAKLDLGSEIAGAIGRNLHAANIVAALYLATGQDAAHTVEGSLTQTFVERTDGGLQISVRLPAVLVGVRGGGTSLPAQSRCLDLLLQPKTTLHRRAQLAETIGAAVLAGEISLLAAQASHHLAKAHKTLGRADSR